MSYMSQNILYVVIIWEMHWRESTHKDLNKWVCKEWLVSHYSSPMCNNVQLTSWVLASVKLHLSGTEHNKYLRMYSYRHTYTYTCIYKSLMKVDMYIHNYVVTKQLRMYVYEYLFLSLCICRSSTYTHISIRTGSYSLVNQTTFLGVALID